jgi:outer membrane protein assembly factor BamB
VWAGWLYATDADTGSWKWRLQSNYPIFSAVTPTAGGLVFFGDMGGNFYALDATTGKKLWGREDRRRDRGRGDHLHCEQRPKSRGGDRLRLPGRAYRNQKSEDRNPRP